MNAARVLSEALDLLEVKPAATCTIQVAHASRAAVHRQNAQGVTIFVGEYDAALAKFRTLGEPPRGSLFVLRDERGVPERTRLNSQDEATPEGSFRCNCIGVQHGDGGGCATAEWL